MGREEIKRNQATACLKGVAAKMQSSRWSLWYCPPILWYYLFTEKAKKKQISWTEQMPEMSIWLAFCLGYFCYKPETNTFYTFPLKNVSILRIFPPCVKPFLCLCSCLKRISWNWTVIFLLVVTQQFPMQYIKCVDNFQPVLSSKSP